MSGMYTSLPLSQKKKLAFYTQHPLAMFHNWRIRGSADQTSHSTNNSHTEAIDADISRLTPLILPSLRATPTTPPTTETTPTTTPTFPHLNAARNFIAQWTWAHSFRYTGWPNIDPRKYRLYVNWAMAQRGLAAGYFKVEGANPPVVNKLVRPVIAQREGEEKYEDKVRAWMEYSTDEWIGFEW